MGVVVGGVALFHGSSAPAAVSLRRLREYITTRAGQQACMGVIIAMSSLYTLCTVEHGD